MSRVLHGMPLNTLPDPGELQPGDQIVAYREDTGKAYRSNIAGLGAEANLNVCDTFSAANTYSAGDYCIYNDVLYKFTADKGIGDWDGSVVEQTNIATELGVLNDDFLAELQALETVTTGSGTRNSSYVSSTTFEANYAIYGRVCVASFCLLMTATDGSDSVNLVTGLPASIFGNTYATLHASTSSGNQDVAVRITSDGNLRYAWATLLSSGATYRGQVVYITSD